MLDALTIRSLHLHSLTSLLADLVSGRPVGTDIDGSRQFALTSMEARALLDWYRKNQRLWSKNVSKDLLPQIVNAAEQVPPVLTSPLSAPITPRVYIPKRVEIFRFGGVQEYASTEPLVVDFDKKLLLLEGHNGSGKTSILNAFVWCLTGKLYRAQRQPADGHKVIRLAVLDANSARDEDDEEDEADDSAVTSALVCPVPAKSVIEGLGGRPLPLETWVSITFIEEGRNREVTVRRRLHRNKFGKPVVEETGFDELNVDPVAFEIGTTMPGLLPHIRIGEDSDLGRAIAELTGLAPLRFMVKHARRVKARIEKDYIVDELEQAIQGADNRFLEERKALTALLGRNSEIAPATATAILPSQKETGLALDAIIVGIKRRQADAFAGAQTLLGNSFDPKDAHARNQLSNRVDVAVAALKPSAIAGLESAAILGGLGKLSEQQLIDCEALMDAYRAEGVDLIELAADPARASRLRLYARVANWHRTEMGYETPPDTCPTCLQPFDEQIDPVTGGRPCDHLAEAFDGGKAHLEKTLAAWAKEVFGALARDLPDALAKTMRSELAKEPADLLRNAFTKELFETDAFSDVLKPLQAHAVALCDRHLPALPAYVEPQVDLTLDSQAAFAELDKAFRRVTRAVAFARWRKMANTQCSAVFQAIIGRPHEERREGPLHEQPLCHQVNALAELVRAAEPSSDALRHAECMKREHAIRLAKEAEIGRARKAAEHLAELFLIGELVQQQLTSLRHRLDEDTKFWLGRLYRAATTGTAPTPHRSAIDPAGKIDVIVERGGTFVSAEHVSNASFLRAYLLAFLIAFWKHVRDVRGGFSVLVLDDPQEMFDPNNRRRLAETIGFLLDDGASLLASTHDSRFALEVCADMRPRNDLLHLSVHGRNAGRACTLLSPSADALDDKRQAFKNSRDNHQAARDYANSFRIFIEARLSDLLDQPAFAQPRKLDLSAILGEVRRLVRIADGFSGPTFEALRDEPCLQQGAAFLNLMNRTHHRESEDLTWGDVEEREGDFQRVRRLALDAHDEYRRWLKRAPISRKWAPISPLAPMNRPRFGTLRRELDLAAFSADEGREGGEGVGTELADEWFADKSIFVLCADTLGFSATIGSALIVECTNSEVDDHRLVVAQHGDRVYARRLLRSSEFVNQVVLVAETEDPLARPPPVVLPTDEVRLYKVVGVLFAAKPVFSRDGNEAYLQPFHQRLREIRTAYQARNNSGVPLVLDGQTVLGGAPIQADALDRYRGRPVAVWTSDGGAFLKRVGEPLEGMQNLRLFESIGGLGDSRLIQLSPTEETGSRLPCFRGAREIIGVLYT